MPRRKLFRRSKETRKLRQRVLIVGEGAVTERQYFARLREFVNDSVYIEYIPPSKSGGKSDPLNLLKRMKAKLDKSELEDSDEAWIVLDRDRWAEAQLDKLDAWSKKSVGYGLALSNPCFEFWLLLHFETVRGSSLGNIKSRLKKLINYDKKSFDMQKITIENTKEAIRRAKLKDKPPCDSWPKEPKRTTVYRLVQKILTKASII